MIPDPKLEILKSFNMWLDNYSMIVHILGFLRNCPPRIYRGWNQAQMIGIGLVLWAVHFISFKGTPSRIFHKTFQRHSAQIINNVVHKNYEMLNQRKGFMQNQRYWHFKNLKIMLRTPSLRTHLCYKPSFYPC